MQIVGRRNHLDWLRFGQYLGKPGSQEKGLFLTVRETGTSWSGSE